ncbi:MAG: carboxypeptidase-like regulatory domain-containing protein [Candidatus Cryptobacteroides sp.]
MKKIFLTLIVLFSVVSGFAQSITVSGVVTSAEGNEALPGVFVVVKGTTTGTSTDIDGSYSIIVEGGGYTTILFDRL